MNLYENNETYLVHSFKDRQEWLEYRIRGIGASESSSILGLNPYKTSLELYEEKIRPKTSIEDKPPTKAQEYGILAEEHLRELFKLTYKDKYQVFYQKNVILQSVTHPFLLYSPDGLIVDLETNQVGIYEGKTAAILNNILKESWKGQIPNNYFIQLLHGLLVTNFDFAILNVELKFEFTDKDTGEKTITYERRMYRVNRENHEEDLNYLLQEVKNFWNNHVIAKVQPPLNIHI
jgi:putative phage-type endonuclease